MNVPTSARCDNLSGVENVRIGVVTSSRASARAIARPAELALVVDAPETCLLQLAAPLPPTAHCALNWLDWPRPQPRRWTGSSISKLRLLARIVNVAR